MADTPKKNTTTATKAATAAKPRKTAAKKTADALMGDPVNGHNGGAKHERSLSHDDVARLAHSYWQQRGGRHGQHMDDWLRAEQELRGRA